MPWHRLPTGHQSCSSPWLRLIGELTGYMRLTYSSSRASSRGAIGAVGLIVGLLRYLKHKCQKTLWAFEDIFPTTSRWTVALCAASRKRKPILRLLKWRGGWRNAFAAQEDFRGTLRCDWWTFENSCLTIFQNLPIMLKTGLQWNNSACTSRKDTFFAPIKALGPGSNFK